MATLAPNGRINEETVLAEIARLHRLWGASDRDTGSPPLEDVIGPQAADLDLFDRVQLETVVAVCRRSRSLSEAGRALFAVSRSRKASGNDADRLRKYLARFGLSFQEACGASANTPVPDHHSG